MILPRPSLFFGLLLAASPAGAASYDAYSESATGSSRHVGLAGAVVAYPDGYAMTFINPAGLSGMTGKGIDFGSDSNEIENFVVNLDDPRSRALNVPIRYSYAGARYIFKRSWGVGFVVQSPFGLDETFLDLSTVRRVPAATAQAFNNESRVKIEVKTYTLAAGKSFLEGRLAAGLGLNFNDVSESYGFQSVTSATSAVSERQGGDALTADLGLLGRPWRWLQLGLVYKMGYRVGFDAGANARLPAGVNWFRDVKVPDRLSFGAAFLPWQRFRLLVQGTYARGMSDTTVAGSGLFPGQTNPTIESGKRSTLGWHWGSELVAFKKSDLTIKLWGGGYLEDTGVQGGFTRYHNTAGFQYSPLFFDFSLAVDRAELYDNFSVGLGVDILNLFERLAKRYRWKLPDP